MCNLPNTWFNMALLVQVLTPALTRIVTPFFFRFQEKIVLYRTVNTVPNLKVKNYTRLQALRALSPSILFLQPKLTKTHNFHHEWPPFFVSLHEKELLWNYCFEYQLMVHFCYIKWIFNRWNSQGRPCPWYRWSYIWKYNALLGWKGAGCKRLYELRREHKPQYTSKLHNRATSLFLKKATPIRGSNSGKGKRYLFSKIVQVDSGAHHSMGTSVHPQGVKRRGRAADHSPVCCAQVLRTAVTYNPLRYLRSVPTPCLYTYACMGIRILIIWEIPWQNIFFRVPQQK
jgi:hypothetical protein